MNCCSIVLMKVTAGDTADLFYEVNGTGFSGTQRKRFDLRNNTEFVKYQLYMAEDPNWVGTITKLRLDPTNASGANVQLDYMLVP